MSIDKRIVDDFVANGVEFVTTVPCKQLAGVIEEFENREEVFHIPSNKEDEGMGLCAGAWMGGKRPAIIMQNTAIGVTINTLATLTQYYRMPLPMIISYRGELREPVACQVEMAVHTKALLMRLVAYKAGEAKRFEANRQLLDGLLDSEMIRRIVRGQEGRINAVAFNTKGDLVALAQVDVLDDRIVV